MKKIKAVSWLFLVWLLLLPACSGGGAVESALKEYLAGVQRGDFETIYRLNARSQKKVALILRGAASHREESLQRNYDELKKEYETVEPEEDLRGMWVEKFIFTSDALLSISNIRILEESGSPESKLRYDKIGHATVTVEYGSEVSAPALGGRKVKTVVCEVVLIKGEDVVQGLKTKAAFPEWVFKDLSVARDAVTYW